MSDRGQQRRKRNRWGAAPSSQRQQPPSPPPAAADVSDQDAMNALLSSARAHQDERDQRKKEAEQSFKRRKNDDTPTKNQKNDDAGYYGPATTTGVDNNNNNNNNTTNGPSDEAVEKHKPNFGLSGALAADGGANGDGGNVYKGVVLKFQEPPEARTPNTLWRLYVFKGEEQLDILHISKQSAYLIGRNEDIADICVQHGSCSSQHAVLQYRALPTKDGKRLNCQPYILDLESTNGTFINGVQIDAARYYQLKKGDVLKFGASTREYVLLTANAKSVK